MKTVTIELVVRTQVPDDTDLTHLSVGRSGVVIPLIEGKPVIENGAVVGYPTHPVEHEHLTHQWRINEGNYTLSDEPKSMAEAIREAQEGEGVMFAHGTEPLSDYEGEE